MRQLLSLMFLIVLNFQTINVFGCSCPPPPTVEAALEGSDAAFSGKCARVEKLNKKDSFGEDMVIVRFDVYDNFKGPDEKTIELHTVENRNSCNGYWFKEGEEYLVYAYLQKDGVADKDGLLGTSFCQGTKLLAAAKEEVPRLKQLKTDSLTAADTRPFAANQNDPGLVTTDKTVMITTDKLRYGLTENVGVTIENKTDGDIEIFLQCRKFISLLDLQAMYSMGPFVEEPVTPGNYKLNIEIGLPGSVNVAGAFEISSNEFTLDSQEGPAGSGSSPQPGVFLCQQDPDCRIVTSYIEPQGGFPAEYVISCEHKNQPFKEGEWIQEYNEYTQRKCICDASSNQCRMKN